MGDGKSQGRRDPLPTITLTPGKGTTIASERPPNQDKASFVGIAALPRLPPRSSLLSQQVPWPLAEQECDTKLSQFLGTQVPSTWASPSVPRRQVTHCSPGTTVLLTRGWVGKLES